MEKKTARVFRLPFAHSPRLLSLLVAIFLPTVLVASCVLSLIIKQAQRGGYPPVPDHRGSRYTIVINTWKRPDLLKRSVAHYSRCSSLASIRIVWSEHEPPSDELIAGLRGLLPPGNKGPCQSPRYPEPDLKGALEPLEDSDCTTVVNLQFDVHTKDSLNNRFVPPPDLITQAIFSVDDDVHVPCEAMNLAFSSWLSAPDAMVGFVPRMHWKEKLEELQGDQQRYRYVGPGWWYVWWTGRYSMILTKAAFLHAKYLHAYSKDLPQTIRAYVTSQRNCEDIAMSMLVANLTRSPPIWVKARLKDYGKGGISSSAHHYDSRSECLNLFTSVFGHMPLVSSHAKVVDARYESLW